jgi:fructose transport system ATP-binding protein
MAAEGFAMSAEKVTANAGDNLLLIKGIGPVNDKKLRAHGIASFAQIASWKQADIVAVEKYLEFDGRIAREDWIGQAKRLASMPKVKAAPKAEMAAKPVAASVKTAGPAKAKAAAKPAAKPAAEAKANMVSKPAEAAAAPKAKPIAGASAKSASAPKAKPAKSSAAPKVSATVKAPLAVKAAAKPVVAPKSALTAQAPVAAKSAPKAITVAKARSAPKVRTAAKPAAPVSLVSEAEATVPAMAAAPAASATLANVEPILKGRGLLKRYGTVVALNGSDFDLYPGEILGVIGDNGAGKSTLIKALTGAVTPDHGEITLEGKPVHFKGPQEASKAGIEAVYQNLALSPALSIADNMFLGREIRRTGILGSIFRMSDRAAMQKFAREKLSELGLMTIQNINQPVETLSGGQRQGVAVARAAAFGSKVVIMDEPTAALGVKESRRVLELIRDVKRRGMPIVLISHNMPHVFEVCDRIHIHRLGKRLCVINPKDFSMSDAVAFMTGAKKPPEELLAA